MVSPVVVLLLLACSVQLSSSIQVSEESVQDLYGVASSYSECTNIYWRRLRTARGIVLVVRSACRKDEGTFRSALDNLQCSDITTAVSQYCSRRYTWFWATNLVCRFVRKVNERCEENDDSDGDDDDDRSPLCKLAISRMPRRWAGITCERYESFCQSSSSRLPYYVRLLCRLTSQFYSQCCGNVPMTEPTTTPEPTTTTTTPEPTTTTTEPPTTQPATTPESSLPEVAVNTFLTACQQQCVRNDLIGSLCTGAPLTDSCNALEPPATEGSYTCCQG